MSKKFLTSTEITITKKSAKKNKPLAGLTGQAIILAAGESSRFWPVNHQHKSQIKIFGQSLVYWTIKGLSKKGIKDIIVVIRPNSSLKEELATIPKDLNVALSFVVQEKSLGPGNAIFRAKDFIKEPFFVFWPDKINSEEIIEKILQKHRTESSQVILVGAKTATPWDYGILKLDGEKVIGICEKPKPGEEPSDIKVAGAYFLQSDFFDYYQKLPKCHPYDFVDVLNIYIEQKRAGFVFLEKEIPELKYPWEVFRVLEAILNSDNFKNYISPTAQIAKNVTIKGKVHIGDNVVVRENTMIEGPCFIGKDCEIGANNVLRGPINLENNVITGAFTEIKNCLIQEGSHFHSGYFGDSIIGRNCCFGVGFTAANRRMDRESVKSIIKGKKTDTGLTCFGTVVGNNTCFGIQSGTMPGVLIGSNCIIGPGTLVFENIEDNTNYYTKFQKAIKR